MGTAENGVVDEVAGADGVGLGGFGRSGWVGGTRAG